MTEAQELHQRISAMKSNLNALLSGNYDESFVEKQIANHSERIAYHQSEIDRLSQQVQTKPERIDTLRKAIKSAADRLGQVDRIPDLRKKKAKLLRLMKAVQELQDV